jgi:hypothetical protein
MSGALQSFVESMFFNPVMTGVVSGLAFKYILGLSDNYEILKLAAIIFGSAFVANLIRQQMYTMYSK